MKSKRRRSRASSRSSGRTQNKGRQGAPAGNGNAKKALKWLDSYDLSTPAGLDAFLRELVKKTWTGELGTRAAGALNGSLRILLEHMTLPALEKRIMELEKKGVNGK